MNKLTYEETHETVNGVLYKLCNKCQKWHLCTEQYFYKNNRNKQDGLFPYCKVCAIDKSKNYIKNNSEKHKENMRKWRKLRK